MLNVKKIDAELPSQPPQLPPELEAPSLPTGQAQSGAGSTLPYLGFASPRTGSSGGMVTWAILQEAGVPEGGPYLAGGLLPAPLPLWKEGARQPAAWLLATQPVEYALDDAYRPANIRPVEAFSEGGSVHQAIECLLLFVEADFAGPASYRDRVRFGASQIAAPWAAAIQRQRPPLPWTQVTARLRGEPRQGKRGPYIAERARFSAASQAEREALYAYLREHGDDLAAVIRQWKQAWSVPF